MISGRYHHGSAGTQNAHLVVGGTPDSYNTEEFDGSTWSTANANITSIVKGTAMGTQNDAMAGGNSTVWSLYNGTTWTAAASLSTNSDYGRGASGGGSAAGFITGDYHPNTTGNTYNWYGAAAVTASITKFNTKTFETEEITITGSAVKIPVFSSTFNVDTKHYGSFDPRTARTALTASYDDEYLGADTVGQLFVTDDGRLNFTYPTASVGYNPDSIQSGSYGSWATGPSVIYRSSLIAGSGSPNAFLGASGRAPAVPNGNDATQEFNGGVWALGSRMIESSRAGARSAGTQNSAVVFGDQGGPTNGVEEYNGTTWAAGGSLINGGNSMAAGGTSANSAVSSGGSGSPDRCDCTEHYDGAAWSAGGAVPSPYGDAGGGGTENAHISNAGNEGSPTVKSDTTRFYNGVNWSLGPDMTLARNALTTAGSQNAAVTFGGRANAPINHTGHTEEWNGTTWSNSGAMSIARYQMNSHTGGSPAGALAAGGDVGASPYTSFHTEEYFGGTFHGTISAWGSGGNLITGRAGAGRAGGQTSALAAGGSTDPAAVTCTEHYDGSVWAAGGALSPAKRLLGGAGSQNAAITAGGASPMGLTADIYNGYVWSEVGNLIQATQSTLLGTQNSALIVSGSANGTQEFNGSTWSAGGALINTRASMAADGSQNSAFAAGGWVPGDSALTEHYDGSSWSAGGNMITARGYNTGVGSQNSALAFGGGHPTKRTCTEFYDGVAWSETGAALGTAVQNNLAAGDSSAALAAGGYPVITTTQEYNRTHSGAPYLLTKKIKVQE